MSRQIQLLLSTHIQLVEAEVVYAEIQFRKQVVWK